MVILGQDPYHGRGQAEGLAFSVAPGVPLPPSLRNIFKEMERDLGVAPPPFPNPGGSLVKWARNGVLLLNTCLTVEEGQPASHAGQGWEVLTDAVIRHVSDVAQPSVFMPVSYTHLDVYKRQERSMVMEMRFGPGAARTSSGVPAFWLR